MSVLNDRVYHEIGRQVPLSKRVSLMARRCIHALFMRSLAPTRTSTIVDIGASEDESEETNVLEKLYPWPERITCCTLGTGGDLSAAHAKVRHVTIRPGAPLPFADGAFDIAYSSAVLEHVGGKEQREAFIAEALRVARAAFIVVPNRWFPIDPHTGVPLLHYMPTVYRRALSGTRWDDWSRVENLDFLSRPQIVGEWPGAKPMAVYTGLPMGPFSSNIAFIRR